MTQHTRPLLVTALLMLTACSGDTLSEAADAEAAAAALVGGEAGEAERVEEDGYDLWEVMVSMSGGAELEVLLFADSGDLFEIKDSAGPFDYADIDALPGQLTYYEAQDIALAEVEGTQTFWEVKYTEDGYFYEFYVMEVGDQLWEIKLWADGGEVYVVEAVDEVD
jgi:uncharacterized membrane protein YkoI